MLKNLEPKSLLVDIFVSFDVLLDGVNVLTDALSNMGILGGELLLEGVSLLHF